MKDGVVEQINKQFGYFNELEAQEGLHQVDVSHKKSVIDQIQHFVQNSNVKKRLTTTLAKIKMTYDNSEL